MVGPAGVVMGRAGTITSAADSMQIRLFGRGAHGSMPQASIDPVVMAAAVVLRLQTIVSREVGASEAAVVTVGVLQAGTKENVIPDEALIKLNVRTFDAGVRARVLAAIERIVKAEAEASGAPAPPRSRRSTATPSTSMTPTRANVLPRLSPSISARDALWILTGAGERGLRRLCHRLGLSLRVLVCRRHGSGRLQAS